MLSEGKARICRFSCNKRTAPGLPVALVWLGRDDYSTGDWPAVRAYAAAAYSGYLLGTPPVGDFLEEGLLMLGYFYREFEKNGSDPPGRGP